jgi:hypothetical protein
MSLIMIKLLKQVHGLTVGDLTLDKLADLAKTAGYTMDRSKAEKLLELAKRDSAQEIEDWIFNDDNFEKVMGAIRKEEIPMEPVLCPDCDEMSVVEATEIPSTKPHVICKHCGSVIYIN